MLKLEKNWSKILDSKPFYIKDLGKLSKFPEFKLQNSEGLTYYELIQTRLKTEGRYYKVIGHGIVKKYPNITGTIEGILDKTENSLIWYKEF